MHLKIVLGAAILLSTGAMSGAAAADPWKGESGHGRDRGYYDQDRRDYGRYDDGRYDDGRHDRGRRYGSNVPRGHLPPPGLCRVWYDDRPAGHQPAPMSCRRAERLAARTGGDVINDRGRTHHSPYAGEYGRDAGYWNDSGR